MQKILQDRLHVRIHKTNLNKFKKIKIIANIFTNDNEIKLKSIAEGQLENSQIGGN